MLNKPSYFFLTSSETAKRIRAGATRSNHWTQICSIDPLRSFRLTRVVLTFRISVLSRMRELSMESKSARASSFFIQGPQKLLWHVWFCFMVRFQYVIFFFFFMIFYFFSC